MAWGAVGGLVGVRDHGKMSITVLIRLLGIVFVAVLLTGTHCGVY